MKISRFFFAKNTFVPAVHRLNFRLSKIVNNLDSKVLVTTEEITYLQIRDLTKETEELVYSLAKEDYLEIVSKKILPSD
ncbi:hypothetical protein ABSDF2788 [Acinetobacter baumannii SDF]|uniref:Uncharacterized protein n=1 Tax=Acinetobacter baumannii (strain SDF) TaxID=509170 RepID=B0VUM5_ACIBS|nr:hypothetical protein ABSDF2788 [Acinetobacter baumannii SDF]